MALIAALSGIGVLSAQANVQSYSDKDLKLGFWEIHKVWLRGFFSPFISINPHPESVSQYLKERELANQLAEGITNFLKNLSMFRTYVSGLGRVLEFNNRLKLEPSFCFVNLEDHKPSRTFVYVSPRHYRGPKIRVTRYRQKSRKTPTLIDSSTDFSCTPEFNASIEAEDSGLNDFAPYSCKNAFAITNKTRIVDSDIYTYFDLTFCNSGTIIGSKEQENIFDASDLPGRKLYFQGNFISLTNADFGDPEIKIEVHNVDIFIGRFNDIDIIDFSNFSQPVYVSTRGVKTSNDGLKDRLINVSQALLAQNTYVYSNLVIPHEYDIDLNNGAINIDLINTEEVSLNFNLTVADLFKIAISRDESSSKFDLALNSDFIKLCLTIDEAEVIINLKKKANVSLWSNSKVQISFEADAENTFIIIEEVAKSVSAEEKLQICHTYQRLISDNKQLACLILSEKELDKELEIIVDSLFINEQGQGHKLVISKDGEFNLIPFYAKNTAHKLTVADIKSHPSFCISFPLKQLIYYRTENDLILGRKHYSFLEFSLSFEQYYRDPSDWNALRLLSLGRENFFNCNDTENCLTGEVLKTYSQTAIYWIAQIRAREQKLFRYFFLNAEYQIIHHNQQLSESGKWQTLTKDKHFAYIKLENSISDIKVYRNESNVIFSIQAASASQKRFEFQFKNWDSSSSHRLEGIIFPGFTAIHIHLSNFLSEDHALMKRYLNRGIQQSHVCNKVKQLLSPSKLIFLKALLINGLRMTTWKSLANKKEAIAKSLGFWNEIDLANFDFLSLLDGKKSSACTLYNSEPALRKTTQALYWLAVHTCLTSSFDSVLVKRLFPMLISPKQGLCSQVARSRKIQTNVSLDSLLAQELTSSSLIKTKAWLVKVANNFESVDSITAKTNPTLSLHKNENYVAHVEIKPTIISPIHFGDSQEQMLGDQPGRGLFTKSNPTYLNRPLGIGENLISPSSILNTAGAVNIDTTVLFLDMFLRKKTKYKRSSVKTIYPKNLREAHQQELIKKGRSTLYRR